MSSAPTDNRILGRHSRAQAAYRLAAAAAGIRHSGASRRRSRRRSSIARAWRIRTTKTFSVVTWFLPKHLHQHFYNVYAYCRISDDLGDEVGDKQQSLTAAGPVGGGAGAVLFAASRGIRCSLRCARPCGEFDIPQHEFSDLLQAFRQDQIVTRYPRFERPARILPDTRRIRWATWCCTCAVIAMPSGRSFPTTPAPRCNWPTSGRMSVRGLTSKGRIYLPLEDFAKFGVSEQTLAERRATPAVSRHDEVRGRARARVVPARPAAGERSGPPAGARHRAVQPWRAGDSSTPSSARITTC